MFNPLLHVDRRQLAAKMYNDPSLAFLGDSRRVIKHRQEISEAITRRNTSNTPNSPTNINRDALYVLDNYPILRNKPKSTARFPLSANANYFAPSYLPKNFKAPLSPQTCPGPQEFNRPRSASSCNNDDNYALAEETENQFVSWRRLSAKPRSSVQSNVVQRITTSASSHHESQSVYSNVAGKAVDSTSIALLQGAHEDGVHGIGSSRSESLTGSQSHAFQSIQMEMQVAEGFNTLRRDILSYLKSTESTHPRSTLEVNALNEMLADLEAKQQIYNDFIKSEYRDCSITLCQCLSSGIDSAPQSTEMSILSRGIKSGTRDNSMKKNVRLTHSNHNIIGNNPGSILSLIMKTQKAIHTKLNAMKTSRLQHSDANHKLPQDVTSSLHDSLYIKPIHPWIRGRSSSASRLSTSIHFGDYQTEDSEIGIAPFNTSKHISNSQVDDYANSQVFREFTLSTSTGIASHSICGNEHLPQESRDYDSPAVALVFVRELDNLSSECLHEHQSESTIGAKKYINCHTMEQNIAHKFDSITHNRDKNLDEFRGAGSPVAISVPANSHMQQDTREISSPDAAEIYTARSVQRIPIGDLKTPSHNWKPQVVKLENTISYSERDRHEHKAAIGLLQPRRLQAYRSVKDYTEKDADYPKELLRVPMSSPQRINLGLGLQSADSLNSPLKFGFLSTLKTKTAEARQRANETIADTVSCISTDAREVTETNTGEKYSDDRRSPSRFTQTIQDNGPVSSSNKILLMEIKRYLTDDILSMYAKFIGTLQEELAKKLGSVEKDLQSKVKTLANQRKTEYESVRLNIAENKHEIMSRISYLQESIRAVLAAHKAGAKNVEKKVQLSLARAGIHERIPQISQTVIEKIKHLYCALSRCLGNWVAMGYEQCIAITCQGSAGNGVRYVFFPCGDSVCDSCQAANPSVCPICLRKYEFSVKADDTHCFNGPPSMLPTRVITSSCSRLRDLLLSLMELEDVEVLGYNDAEKKFAAKESTASWQAYSRKLDMKGLHKHRT